MPRCHPVPRLWLMTDERQGETLWRALERLPERSGVVFRHYSLPAKERHRLFEGLAALVDASLVRRLPDDDGESVYRMLVPIRE